MSKLFTPLFLIAISLVCGCGEAPPPQGTVSGTIEFKKAPSSPLDIIIFDASTGKAASTGIEDGQFSFGDPILTGDYVAYLSPKVDLNAQEPVAVKLDKNVPNNYYSETETPLKFKVDQGANKVSFVVE